MELGYTEYIHPKVHRFDKRVGYSPPYLRGDPRVLQPQPPVALRLALALGVQL